MKVLFAAGDPKPERWIDPLRELLPEAEIGVWDPEAASVGADYAIVWNPPAALFEREPNLKAIFSLGAGVDGLMALPHLPPELTVVRLEDAGMSEQMAEYVLHHLVDISRGMAVYRQQQSQSRWKLQRPANRRDWPVGVMGLGQIGAKVAATLAGLGYPVHGWARSRHTIDGVQTFAGPEQLDAFLGATRVLVNTLPLTDATRNLIDQDLLSKLQPDAVVINVGRGEHLVEADLERALNDGKVMHAVLDVFRQEPLPAEHPFWQHPAITITPHVSARTLREATVAQIADKLRALAQGQPVSGVVDRSRGY